MSTGQPHPYRAYVVIWACLLLLTALTVGAATLRLGRFSVAVALGIASLKAWLVLSVFMHLRHEDVRFKLMLLVTVATLTLIIGMTFTDIGFRYFEEAGMSHVF